MKKERLLAALFDYSDFSKKFRVSFMASSTVSSVCQLSSALALDGFAQNSGRSPARRSTTSYGRSFPLAFSKAEITSMTEFGSPEPRL